MKLITEYVEPEELEILTENTDKEPVYKIKGIMIQSEVKNRNGRKYPRSLIEREVNRYINQHVNNKTAVGELNHPQTADINLERACHLIESMSIDGDNVYGVSKILSTPVGKTVSALLKDGVKLGVSTRGVGTITDSLVNNDYKLICVDVVQNPSAPEAYVEGILENKEFIIGKDGRIVETAIDVLEKKVSNIPKSGKRMYLNHLLNEFFREITKRTV